MRELGKAQFKAIQGRTKFSSGNLLGGIRSDNLAFDMGEDVSAFMSLCKSEDGLASAIGMLRAMSAKNSRTSGYEKAVYVIAVEGRAITKIGISADPIKRLRDLNNSHYRKLRLHGVVFCPTRKSGSIEQEALLRATLRKKRLKGEWTELEPDEALQVVLESARDGDWPTCDGRTYLDNMIARTKALHAYRCRMGRYQAAA